MRAIAERLRALRSPLCRRVHGVGLDVGSTFVKVAVIGRRSGAPVIEAAAQAPIRAAADAAEAERNAVDAILECLRAAAPDAPHVICGLRGPEVAVRHFSFPPMPPEEVAKAVVLEAGLVCPFPIERSAVDYAVIAPGGPRAGDAGGAGGAGDNRVKGIIAAATNDVVAARERLIERAGRRCVLMDVEGLALLNCLEACGHAGPGSAAAIVNVGATSATVVTRNEDAVPCIRDLPHGGDELVRATAARSGLPAEAIGDHLFGRQGAAAAIAGAFGEASQKLVDDIGESVRCSFVQRRALVDRIYVCGGFARACGFLDVLRAGLGHDVAVLDPFAVLGGATAQGAGWGSAFAVAVGLAVRSY
jgi:type IV pilus assembly protein PilM